MSDGVEAGQRGGGGSDLEDLWVELSPSPSLPPPSPAHPPAPAAPNQLPLAVRRPPVISSSEADADGKEVGGREGGRM